MFNAIDLEHFNSVNPCTKCSFDLSDLARPEPAVCTICGEICYNPCRKGKEDQPSSEMRACQVRIREPLGTKRDAST